MAGKASEAEGVRASAELLPGGRHEIVTLRKTSTTPRARSLAATFKRVRTPPGESQPARRQRKKNEGKLKARAICRLDADVHERYKEAERARKRPAVPVFTWEQPTCWHLKLANWKFSRRHCHHRWWHHCLCWTTSSAPVDGACCCWRSPRASRGPASLCAVSAPGFRRTSFPAAAGFGRSPPWPMQIYK